MFKKIKPYFKEVKQEFKHVNWLTKKEAIKYTVMVIGFSVAMSVFLGFCDFAFMQILSQIII
ncbi:MAG: preprotein translocase subunit SecE [Candidatus Paceibacterota bacterium]|jgi:preprotein translocase SecE subunit|nr:preprotein translocase subunit SecE [Candidatus Paceibacterota bacterium]HQM34929.1 preprotein translocase subunit SecE [Candidatus Paceibacterota bacterium]